MIVLQQEQILRRHTVVTSAKVIEEIGLENKKTFFSNRTDALSLSPLSEREGPDQPLSIKSYDLSLIHI